MRFDVEKFDGRINFGLWQVQVKDVLIQSGLHKALMGNQFPAVNQAVPIKARKNGKIWI